MVNLPLVRVFEGALALSFCVPADSEKEYFRFEAYDPASYDVATKLLYRDGYMTKGYGAPETGQLPTA